MSLANISQGSYDQENDSFQIKWFLDEAEFPSLPTERPKKRKKKPKMISSKNDTDEEDEWEDCEWEDGEWEIYEKTAMTPLESEKEEAWSMISEAQNSVNTTTSIYYDSDADGNHVLSIEEEIELAIKNGWSPTMSLCCWCCYDPTIEYDNGIELEYLCEDYKQMKEDTINLRRQRNAKIFKQACLHNHVSSKESTVNRDTNKSSSIHKATKDRSILKRLNNHRKRVSNLNQAEYSVLLHTRKKFRDPLQGDI